MLAHSRLPVLIAGGGIGGLATALALGRRGIDVLILEQSSHLEEVGAGIQLAPNAFAACDALGIGDRARSFAVYTEHLALMDAVDESEVARIPVGDAFRNRFGNPYAVVHRADIHTALLDRVRESQSIEVSLATKIVRIQQTMRGVEVTDCAGRVYCGSALVGCDGVKSTVRQTFVGDAVRVSGHVVYRAVVDAKDFPDDLKWNAPVAWAGPDCHLVHYPLRNGEQYNLVVTFHSRQTETWGVTEGSANEVQFYFQSVGPRSRRLLALPKNWRRWATADRDPIGQWSFGRVTLLGDAAHPMLQYLAQGACMALEDAVTLGEALDACNGEFEPAFDQYQRARVTRTARVALCSREMGRIYHAKGVERLVRNELWKKRAPERYYDALEWLYGWRVEDALRA
jgi:salicylate hydroxylase